MYHVAMILIVWRSIYYSLLAISREGQLGAPPTGHIDPIRSPSWRTDPLPIRFHLVQPWQRGNLKDLLVHHTDLSRGPQYIAIHLSFLPARLLCQSQTPLNIWWFSENSEAIKGANLAAQKQTPEAKFSSFVATLKKVSSSSPFLSGASCSSNHPEWFTGSGWQQSTRPFYDIKRCQPSPELDPERHSGEQKTWVWHVHLLRLLFTKIESFTCVKGGKRERRGWFSDIKRTSK